jgi:hypothetical protein
MQPQLNNPVTLQHPPQILTNTLPVANLPNHAPQNVYQSVPPMSNPNTNPQLMTNPQAGLSPAYLINDMQQPQPPPPLQQPSYMMPPQIYQQTPQNIPMQMVVNPQSMPVMQSADLQSQQQQQQQQPQVPLQQLPVMDTS